LTPHPRPLTIQNQTNSVQFRDAGGEAAATCDAESPWFSPAQHQDDILPAGSGLPMPVDTVEAILLKVLRETYQQTLDEARAAADKLRTALRKRQQKWDAKRRLDDEKLRQARYFEDLNSLPASEAAQPHDFLHGLSRDLPRRTGTENVIPSEASARRSPFPPIAPLPEETSSDHAAMAYWLAEKSRAKAEQKRWQKKLDEQNPRRAGPAERVAANWKLFVGVGLVVIAVGALGATAAFIGARHVVFDRPFFLTAVPTAEELAIIPPASQSGPAFPPAPASEAACEMELYSPAAGDEIPVEDALHIEWSAVEHADRYQLTLTPPLGAGSPWVLDLYDTSKGIYMSNFPAAGEYRLQVAAFAGDGSRLCGTEFAFEKAAYLLNAPPVPVNQNQPPPGAGQGAPGGPDVVITPTWDPADGSTDYGGCPGCDANDGDVIVK
jgi:hypothetical protein